MTSLDLLQTSLKNPASIDDHAAQGHFDKIVVFIEREKITEAKDLIEKVFAKGLPDIRLIVYYYYAHFFNHGIKSFLDIFPGIVSIIKDHWDALRPVNLKDKHVQNSLNWFILHIINKLKYCERLSKTGKVDAIWAKSIETPQEDFDKILNTLAEFKDFFFAKWPTSPIKERILHLLKMMEDIKSLVESEKQKEAPIEEPPVLEEKPVEEVKEESPLVEEERFEEDPFEQLEERVEEPAEMDLQAEQFLQEPLESIQEAQEEIQIACEKMQSIADKLKVFEMLIRRQDYAKAALVAKDIDHQIENFDPLLYFPKMFSKYFSLTARNVAALSEEWEKSDSLQSKYLDKLYKTDLDMFMEW